jgi:murein L,D-transpeptidase YcbB/YkuD
MARRMKGGGLAVVLLLIVLMGSGGQAEAVDELPPLPPKPPIKPPVKARSTQRLDLDRARIEAQSVANDLRESGQVYNAQKLADWQAWAGLSPDGMYGGKTRGALLYFGARDVPPPFVQPLSTQPYTPPGGSTDELKGAVKSQASRVEELKASAAADLARRAATMQKVPSEKEATSPAGTVTRPPPPLPRVDQDDRQEEMFPPRKGTSSSDEFGTQILANSTTKVSPLLQPSPTGPQIPAGYAPAKAKAGAAALSRHLATKGRAAYSRDQLKTWQRHAGLTPDGMYGGSSRGALIHFGVKDPPRPFFSPVATIPYVPPEMRA